MPSFVVQNEQAVYKFLLYRSGADLILILIVLLLLFLLLGNWLQRAFQIQSVWNLAWMFF